MIDHDLGAISTAAAARLLRWVSGQLDVAAGAASVDDAIYLAENCPVLAKHFAEMDRLRAALYIRGVNFSSAVMPAAMQIIRTENPPEEIVRKVEQTLRKAISGYSAAAVASLKDEQRVTSIAEFLIQNHADLADYSEDDVQEAYNFSRSFVLNARRKSTPTADFTALDRELDELVA